MNSKLAGRLLRGAVAVVLTAFILWWKTDPAEVWRVLSSARPLWVFASAVLVLVDRFLNAYRSVWLLCPIARADRPRNGAVIRVFFESSFAGTFLPGTVGGDMVRAYSLKRLRVPGGIAAASVAMDRLLGALSLLIVAALGLWLGGASDLRSNPVVELSLVVVGLVCAAAIAMIFSERAAALAQRVVAFVPWEKFKLLAADGIRATRAYAPFHGRLAVVLAATVGVQGLRMLQVYCLGRALAIHAPAWAYAEFLPLIFLVVMLPISVSGIGTSQAAFVWLFGRVGTPESQAFALSVLFVLLNVVGSLPGAIAYALGPSRAAADERTPDVPDRR